MNEPGSFKKEFEWGPFITTFALAAGVAKLLWTFIYTIAAPLISKAL